VDEPSQWERIFLANVAIPADEWGRRQRRVRTVGIILATLVGALVLLAFVASGGRINLVLVALLALGAGCLVLLRNLHRWMGVMRGASEHHARKGP
jgi:EamA domain-containing membrane protein RarD